MKSPQQLVRAPTDQVDRAAAHSRIRSLTACIAVAALCVSIAHGSPYIPVSDATVLTRLPALEATRQLASLRRAVLSDPTDLSSALQLARGYIEVGRNTSDPRFVSYAQAVLAPWMLQNSPPAAVLVLQATALQNLHRFDAALALLERAIAIEPNSAQAWLTKATLHQVQGHFAETRTSCQRLLRSADQLLALTCLMTVDSLSGRLVQSYESLQKAAAGARGKDETGWVSGQLAEMAVRLGEWAAAERHFLAALRAAPDDVYLQAAYADLLLLHGRNAEVIELLGSGTSHDVLLLRLAIAAHRSKAPDAAKWRSMFDARRRAVRPDDNPHLREHARFLLDVLDRPAEALSLARRNWSIQKEPADVQIYARAARATGSSIDERILQAWISDTGFEDRTLGARSVRVQR